jgi:DNA polymerase-4
MSSEADDPTGADLTRKIIHIDMDAFYASVEQRDNPELKGKPVAVGGTRERGVVAAASYEARAFRVRSAMPSASARRRCPDLIFVKPRFDVYRAVSQQIRAIFADYTDLIEPLSLDEAYLDVTEDRCGAGSATAIAEEIRARIRAETGLTASAGVSYNKFLAKIASDQNKPDGICVITPAKGPAFVESLAIERFHGIGPATAKRMHQLGIFTGLDLRDRDLPFMQRHFGKAGGYYHRASRGIDHRPVRADRERKSIGSERTFFEDLHGEEALVAGLMPSVDAIVDHAARHQMAGRTLTLKLRYSDFRTITRARTVGTPLREREPVVEIALSLLQSVQPLDQGVRLLGLTLSSLLSIHDEDPGQSCVRQLGFPI